MPLKWRVGPTKNATRGIILGIFAVSYDENNFIYYGFTLWVQQLGCPRFYGNTHAAATDTPAHQGSPGRGR